MEKIGRMREKEEDMYTCTCSYNLTKGKNNISYALHKWL